MVMTYAPLEGEAAAQGLRSDVGGSWCVRHVMIHELSQVKVSTVSNFLEGELLIDVVKWAKGTSSGGAAVLAV